MAEKVVLGLDIGNCYGYVSAIGTRGDDPVPMIPDRYHLAEGMPTTAYVAPPDGASVEVYRDGKPAEKRYARDPEHLVRAAKTRLPEGTFHLHGIGEPVDAAAVCAAQARDLVALANEELRDLGMTPSSDVVFAFPAEFADQPALLEKMQQAIESIATDSGQTLRVLGRLPEPAAAAIDYLHYRQYQSPEVIRIPPEESLTILVYDLGHGTFDAAIVTARGGEVPYELHSKAGLADVGGCNFDEILEREFIRQLKDLYGCQPQSAFERESVREAAVAAKHELTDAEESVRDILLQDECRQVSITREQFEELGCDLIYRTLEIVQGMLDEAETDGIRIDAVVLCGGSSRMPMVHACLEKLVGKDLPVHIYRPSQAVSYGAARYGRSLVPDEDPVLNQLTDCRYGVWMPSADGPGGEIRLLIDKGEIRPASDSFWFTSASSHVTIKLYRSGGELGEWESMLWFPFAVREGSHCEATVTVTEDYSVEVEVKDGRSAQKKSTADLASEINR